VSDVYMMGKATALPADYMSQVQTSGAEGCYLSPPGALPASQAVFSSMLPLAHGLAFADMLPGIDPLSTQMQLDYDGYLSPDSLSSGSSSSSSPPAAFEDQSWTTALVTSPTETGISSPEMLTHDAR
jgi:hypothetical protein